MSVLTYPKCSKYHSSTANGYFTRKYTRISDFLM